MIAEETAAERKGKRLGENRALSREEAPDVSVTMSRTKPERRKGEKVVDEVQMEAMLVLGREKQRWMPTSWLPHGVCIVVRKWVPVVP